MRIKNNSIKTQSELKYLRNEDCLKISWAWSFIFATFQDTKNFVSVFFVCLIFFPYENFFLFVSWRCARWVVVIEYFAQPNCLVEMRLQWKNFEKIYLCWTLVTKTLHQTSLKSSSICVHSVQLLFNWLINGAVSEEHELKWNTTGKQTGKLFHFGSTLLVLFRHREAWMLEGKMH